MGLWDRVGLWYRSYLGGCGPECVPRGFTQTKQVNMTCVQYFCVHQKVVSTSSFILHPLFILLPHNLHQLPFSPIPLPPTYYTTTPPPTQEGIQKSKTASLLTAEKDLIATNPLCQPPHLWICICHCYCYHIQQRTPLPSTSSICCHHHR